MSALARILAPLLRRTRWLLFAALGVVLGMSLLAAAQTAPKRDFDHLGTGFALTGAHTNARCESCHVNAVFKGTPRDCASCHREGARLARGNVVLGANHLPTQQACDSCHKTQSFALVRFNHAGVASGSCQTCHNGATTQGKPATHIATSGSCDSCHRTAAWLPASGFDHSGVTPGTCSTCHNGNQASGRSASHMPVGTAACDACHRTGSAWRPTTWNHTQVATAGQCATCHTGAFPPADGRPSNHIPYASVPVTASANCDACHKGSMTTWANGRLHANAAMSTACATCHTGGFMAAVGKPSNATHANVTGNCETCHKTTASWAGAKVDHGSYNASTNCTSCHDGSTATAKSATHIPIGSTGCFACHSAGGAWTPTKWNHSQVATASQCATCHTGGFPPADGRPSNHIPYTSVAVTASANCDTCHKGSTSTWANGRLHANASVSTSCATCHTGGFMAAVGKPSNATHANVTGNCETCHKTTSSWSGAKVDHSTYNASTNCTSCHDGSTATAKPATHMPTGTAGCFACHSAGGAWTPTKWNHTQVATASQCATCHTGGFPPADGRPSNHIPYTSVPVTASANCDACHKGSTSTWANGRLHANAALSTNCATCHTGAYMAAVGKPSNTTHASVTGNCESCHKTTTSWAGAKVDHSTYNASTNCASCHNGSGATGKSATHIPTGTAGCFACHSAGGAWTPTKWNHTQVATAAQCASCHTGGFPPADGRPATHIPYQAVPVTAAANCDTCHKGSTTTWANGRLHANATLSTNCATCHTGGYMAAIGKPTNATHATVTGSCENCHKSTSTWSGAKVDHSTYNASTNCASCHNGSGATGKSATHIPTGTAGCFACHSAGGAWTPTKWNHTQVTVTAQCASCHSGAFPPADGRPATHIPYQAVPVTAAANCDTCHKGSTTTWANGRLHANATLSTNCATCHTGGYMAAIGKPTNTTHAAVTGNCESCHKSTASWTSGVVFAHNASNAVGTGTCDTCHNGVQAKGKSATHIPIPAGAAKCDSCHRSQSSFTTSVTMNHSVVTAGACKSCHNGSYTSQGPTGALAKPANHIPEVQLLGGASMDCNACHTSTTSWGTQRMNHNASQGNGAGWCKACHQSGTSFLGSMEKKSLTHERSTGVTDCSQSGCHRPLGTKGAAYTKWD